MQGLQKKLRKLSWLVQSLCIRYKKQIIFGFVGGVVIVIIGWQIANPIRVYLFPKTNVIGMVGLYEPSKLPLSIQNLISYGFTSINQQGEAKPLMAETWEVSQDGKRYFFHMVQNRYWHDGTEFTAYDVNYNFKDVIIAAADRYTLKIELEEPFAPLPNLLSRPLFRSGLVGVGPYRVVQLELFEGKVKRLMLKPFDNPKTVEDERVSNVFIEYKFYPTADDAILAFKMGDIDYLNEMVSADSLRNEPNVVISEYPQHNRFMAIFFNIRKDVLKTREMRQALSYATTQIEGKKIYSPIPESSWAYNVNVKDYKYDLELAKTLFEKAAVATDSIHLELSTFPEHFEIARQIQEDWKKLGIDAQINVVLSFPYEYDIFLGIQEIPSDPDQYALWHSTQESTNITHYNNPKIDKLLEDGRKKSNQDERLMLYRDFQRYLVDDAPARFLIHPSVYTIRRK